jgi:hypothetical protein
VGAADRVYAVRIDAEHNYNRASREAMYAWMARWLQKAAPDARPTDRSFTPDPLPDLLVFHGRTLPPGAVTAAQLTEDWVRRAAQQLAAMPSAFGPALRHALGFAWPPDPPSIDERRGAAGAARAATKRGGRRPVLLATTETSLAAALTRAGFEVESIAFTPFDAESASKIRHFETYNRTAASQRVADIVAAIRRHPGAPLIADGDAALAGLLAAAIVEVPRAILDVGRFDRSSDAAFLEHLDIPGLRRAGDLQTAATLARGKAIVHNAGERFGVSGLDVRPQPLTASEIVALLRQVK